MTDMICNFVLDRSGSMTGMWREVIGAVNSYIEDRRAEDGNTWLTLTAFDHEVLVPYEAWGVQDLDLDKIWEDVHPRGMTALVDAFAGAIHATNAWLASNQWFSGKVAIAVMTDGLENASKEYTNQQLTDLIKQKQDVGWSFTFLGANQDSFSTARDLGVDLTNPNNFVSNYAAGESQQRVASASHSVRTFRTS